MNESKSRTQKDRQRFKRKTEKLKVSSKASLYTLAGFFLIVFIAYIGIVMINQSHKTYAMEVNLYPPELEQRLIKQMGVPLDIYVDAQNKYWYNYEGMLPHPINDKAEQVDFPQLRELFQRHYDKYQNLLVIIKINRRADSKHFVNIVDEFELVAEKLALEKPNSLKPKIPLQYFLRYWSKDDDRLFGQL